jgi:hypothetical protein
VQLVEALHVEPVYVSQWFLSFFAVACPLPMLLRIYDVVLEDFGTDKREGVDPRDLEDSKFGGCSDP